MKNPTTRTGRRRRIAIVVFAVIVVSAVIVGFVLHYHRFPKRLAVVEEGVLYRSAQPSATQIGNLVEDFGIRTIIIVREGSSRRVPDETEAAEQLGVHVVHIPIKSRQAIPDEQVAEFFRYVDAPEHQPTLVHCSAGRHRTGYLCAMYRIERQGWSVERALEEMRSFGFDTESQHAVLHQLEQYKPRGCSPTEELPPTSRQADGNGDEP
ncbi:MAG: tyrosine-protein phosphatase [Planctomycetota bacterium]